MNQFANELNKSKIWKIFPWLIIPLTMFKALDYFFIPVSMLIATFSTIYAFQHKEEDGKNYIIQNIITDILLLYYFASATPVGTLMAYLSVLFCGYSTKYKKNYAAIFLAACVSQVIMVIFVDPEIYWGLPYTALIMAYNLAILVFLGSVFNYKAAVVIHFSFHAILRIANLLYASYRFSTISIMDIFSLPTFFSIAGDYNLKLNDIGLIYLVCCLICLWLFMYIKNFKISTKKRIKAVSGILVVALFFVIGERAYLNWQNATNRSIYFFDAFALSAVEQVNIWLDRPDPEEQTAKINTFPADTWEEGEIKPHIVTIMSESYADVVDILDLDVNKNPTAALYQRIAEDNHFASGEVHVNTIGGGTSVSEWGYLMGLNCADFSVLRNPFMTDVHTNYAFTADSLYDDYRKVFMHPFRRSGWNRVNVYETLQYDEKVFLEDVEYQEADFVRNFIGDARFMEDIKGRIVTAESPLFSMNVTMQNHGGYGPNSGNMDKHDIKISNSPLSEEDTQKAETYLNLQDLSTQALLDLISFLEDHPEYPTLLIFFGDHYPSDVPVPETEIAVSYATPYVVYCNYKEISEMPDYMDLSLLLPNAKKAVDLPLTSWEKYLLSLNGQTADRDMILYRIQNGHIE